MSLWNLSEACVRLCLHSWAQGHCTEAPYFSNDECKLLCDAFGLRQTLLQPEEDLLVKPPSGLVSEATAPKSIRNLGKIKVQDTKQEMVASEKGAIKNFQICGKDVPRGYWELDKVKKNHMMDSN